MSTANPFVKYVELVGGPTEAARRLGISRSLVGHICNGRRAVSKRLAVIVEQDSNGVFRREALLWPDEKAA
jgi:DNA-binding transcriptional regulator YdaS (Cro superfamily)